MSTITYENINIEGVPFSKILELEISHRPGSHGTARVIGQIPLSQAAVFTQRVDETFAVNITTSAQGQPAQLFYGLVSRVTQEQQNDYAVVSIEAVTTSASLDAAPKSKTFQQTSMTYGQILNQVIAGRGTVLVTGTDKPIGSFIIQSNETDWQFMIRMAAALGAPACASLISPKPYIYIGPPPPSAERSIETIEYSSSKDISGFASFQGSSAMADDFGGSVVTAYDYAYLGDILNFNGKTLNVKGIQAQLRDGILQCRYSVGLKSSFLSPSIPNNQVSGKIMTGIVQAVEADKVKVFFYSVDSEFDGGGDWWFPYSTAYSSSDGSGWYSMPAEGDEVRVFFPSSNEKDAFAASSTQQNPGASVTDKVWSGPNGKQILMTEEGLMIIGKAGKIFINLLDESGIKIISEKNISITSSNNVTIQAGGTVSVLAEEHILVGTQQSYVDIRNEGITLTSPTILLT